MKVKFTILLIVSFSLGFALHWLISEGKNLFIAGTQVQPVSLLGQNVLGRASQDQFITYVDYDGKSFKPGSVIVKKGNYLAITNKSKDQLMWLISQNLDLNTQRGYGEGEKLQLTLLKEGEFKVIDKLNPNTSLVIKVE